MGNLRLGGCAFKSLIILSIIALALQLACIIINDWFKQDVEVNNVRTRVTTGLWKICAERKGQKKCFKIPDENDWLESVRAFSIICLILIVLEMLILGLFAANSKVSSKTAKFTLVVTTIFSALSGATAFGVYIFKVKDISNDYVSLDPYIAFFIQVGSTAILLISSILSCLAF